MTVGTQDPTQRFDEDDARELWRQVGRQLARAWSRLDAGLDHLETDVAGLKTDVGVLKIDVGVLKINVAELKTDVIWLKSDVAELRADVAGLKTGLAETRAQLDRFEQTTGSRFDRIDARIDELLAYIKRDEANGRPEANASEA